MVTETQRTTRELRRTGVWVVIPGWHAVEVFVSQEEIARAVKTRRESIWGHKRNLLRRVAENIALGKLSGSYPRIPEDTRPRVQRNAGDARAELQDAHDDCWAKELDRK